MKVRKRPVVVDAWRLQRSQFGGSFLISRDMPDWVDKALCKDSTQEGALFARVERRNGGPPDWHVYIKTLEGVMHASWGDWLIRGVRGELYACKPEIFEQTYEVAE